MSIRTRRGRYVHDSIYSCCSAGITMTEQSHKLSGGRAKRDVCVNSNAPEKFEVPTWKIPEDCHGPCSYRRVAGVVSMVEVGSIVNRV